jgi:error-prone DNA polymerase
MYLLRSRLPRHLVSIRELSGLPDGFKLWIPGLIVCRQRPGTAKGITFLLLEDEFGLVNVVVYPDLYERQRLEVRSTPMLIIEGRLQLANNNVNIVAERLHPMENITFASPNADKGWEEPSTQPANPERIQLVRLTGSADGAKNDVNIRAIVPASHNYR